MACRFLSTNDVCTCKVGKRGAPYICTDPCECTLRQTEAEQKRSLYKAWERFLSLSVSQQNMYRILYYGGRYPWEGYNDNNYR